MVDSTLIITAIGRKVALDSGESDTFDFILDKYKKLLDWDGNNWERLLRLNMYHSTGFSLKVVTSNDNDYLTLFYSQNDVNLLECRGGRMSFRQFLISSFFESVKEDDLKLTHEQKDHSNTTSIEYFYEHLKESHVNDNFDSVPENVQHPSLKPTTRLRPYQIKGIKWMLKRELEVEELPSLKYLKMRSKLNNDQIMYFNPNTLEFTPNLKTENYPSGGILCDEMGLGKTVEMITLILMNPRPKNPDVQISASQVGSKRKANDSNDNNEIPVKKLKALSPTKKSKIKCICHGRSNTKKKDQQKENLIICRECHYAQHKKCVGIENENINNDCAYICPVCYKASKHIVMSSATIIVTPGTIKRQWYQEIQRHVQDPNFKVLLYNGIYHDGWVSPEKLATYDIIITDFSTLSRELYFVESTNRKLRREKKFEYPPSPLLHVKFWRVVCDEAQMVENAESRPSQMVQILPAVHRWGCTGTPIERGSIHNLFGLVYFLDIHPYSNYKNFNSLWLDYRAGKSNQLIKFLSKIMWRTCKKDVLHQIDIPEQKEIIHYVEMTDLQKCYYQQVHETTKSCFFNFIRNYITFYDRVNKRWFVDESLKDKILHELDNGTLTRFLEPLRNLRQDCTIANLFINVNDQTRIKQTLNADQLHEHLVKKTTMECKQALRTICSSHNGIAALKIYEKNYEAAKGLYKQVLRLAKDFNAPNGVHVDSMLQIHSFNGLMDIAEITQDKVELEQKSEYLNEMIKLEWKYIRNYYEKVEEINKQINESRDEFKLASRNYTDRDGEWWMEIIHNSTNKERLIDCINAEFLSGVNINAEQVRTTYGIQLILTEWTDKIEKYSKDIKKSFKNFNYIIRDLRPSNELNDEVNMKISRLAKAALDCHLNLLQATDEEQRAPRDPSNLCDLCKLKRKLDEYECILFNKTLVDDVVEGTWNPRLEERVLKAIFSNAKRANFNEEEIEMGKFFFKYLEALKKNYKILAQLWVEVNYTIAAYDEINMCKIRMQVVNTPEEITEDDARVRLKILPHEVEHQIHTFNDQKIEAEINFTRLNGRLKYLNHLKETNETPTCPICTNQPTSKYFVTVCGHSICDECFGILTKDKRRFPSYERLKINCPVCRTSQEIHNILTVSCVEQIAQSNEPIVGCFSPKIDEIIRCVLRLRRDNEKVKILIFSQWDTILSSIAIGFKNNNISYRASFKANFTKQIEEFKDSSNNVTCMMLGVKCAGKGLNIIEATHVFFVEPILNADEELQAVGRVHRIGQTKNTFIHKFITKNTVEEAIYNKIIQEKERWMHKKFTIRDLENLFENDNSNY